MFKYKFIVLNNVKNDNIQLSHFEPKQGQNINNKNAKLYIFLLLMINFYLLRLYLFNRNNNENINFQIDLNEYENILSNRSIYNLYEYKQISILIHDINNWNINQTSLLNFIDCIKQQTLNDIQVILILPEQQNFSKYDLIKAEIKDDEKFEIFVQTGNEVSNTNYLMNRIKGKFIFILDKLVFLKKNVFENIFLMTNGKIDNYFEIQIQNISFHIIKAKIFKNLIDNGQLFNNYNKIIKNIIRLPNPQLNYISIAICPDDYYVPFTYVSMISILSSKDEFTFISFYIIITKEFHKKNIDFLMSLYEQFDYFNISFITMDNRYKNAYVSRRMTVQTYFRFSLGEFFPYLNRILYLDSDTIVYKDLNKLFNLNFNGKIVLGQVTGYNRSKKTGYFNINNGILLFNLYQMRKLKIEEKVLNIIKKKEKLRYHDQTLLNRYFKEYIGIFPLEYHIRNWGNFEEAKRWNKIAGSVYDEDYFYFAQKYPYIRHFLGPQKPIKSEKNHIEDWWYFARKSKYYKKKSTKFDDIFYFNK